ncbi:MAG: hypothetical protein ACRC6R_06185 [Bacteroidales bacterium]
MKNNIEKLLHLLGGVVTNNFRNYPFEIISTAIFAFIWSFELASKSMHQAIPISLFSILFLNNLSTITNKRIIYYLSSPIVIILLLTTSWYNYFNTHEEAYISTIVILASITLLCHYKESMEVFSQRIITLFNSILIAILISLVTVSLILLSSFAILELFQLRPTEILRDQLPLFITIGIVLPQAFLYQLNTNTNSPFTPVLRFVSKWIILPLNILFTFVLYIFLIRIAITQEIPKGIVSFIIFAFIFVSIYLSLMLPPQTNKIYKLLHKHLHYIFILPLSFLFVYTVTQIMSSGLTIDRYLTILTSIVLFIYIFISFKSNINKFSVTLSIGTLLLLIAMFAPYVNIFELTHNKENQVDSISYKSEFLYNDNSRQIDVDGYKLWVPYNNDQISQFAHESLDNDTLTIINNGEIEIVPIAKIIERRVENYGFERFENTDRYNHPDSLFIIECEIGKVILESYYIQLTYTNQIKVNGINLRGLLLK